MDRFITVKKACRGDLAAILQLQKRTFSEVAEQIGRPDIPPLFQTLEELNREFEAGIVLKAVAGDDAIVGSVRAREDENGVCRIGKLIVDPLRQRRGIGRKLMTAVEDAFPAARKFALFTSQDTPHTLSLYQALGYRVAGSKTEGEMAMVCLEKLRS